MVTNLIRMIGLLLISTLSNFAVAQEVTSPLTSKEKIIHSKTTPIQIELNTDTLICSRADYAGEFLKVLIPKIADLTFLDHQNTGAGAPCMAAGQCEARFENGEEPDIVIPGLKPNDILDVEAPTEDIVLTIELLRVLTLDSDSQTCDVTMVENLSTNIRGQDFIHTEYMPVGSRNYNDCLRD